MRPSLSAPLRCPLPAACLLLARGCVVLAFVLTACKPDPKIIDLPLWMPDARPPALERDAGVDRPMDLGTAIPPVCNDPVCCVGPDCPKRPPGSPCQTPDQCSTGFCADKVCCNVACNGACVACNLADRMGECITVAAGQPDPHLICRNDSPDSCGQSGVCNGQGGCAKHPAGTPCSDPSCADPQTMLPPSECDGEGACVAGEPVPCLPFRCEGRGCRGSCTSDSQCLAPHVCLEGSCGQRGKGQNCSKNEECLSGFCADGVCCETACTGRCTTCASARARGTCVPVAAGTPDPRAATGVTDPALVCLDRGADSCGSNGRCDGRGGCELYRAGTICARPQCDPGKNSGTASGQCRAGKCEIPEPRACAPFQGCDGNRCSTHCSGDHECVPGTVCVDGSCGKRAIGSVCSRNDECAAPGICAQGRCCASSCDKPCMACNLEGTLGTCSAVPAGGADPSGGCRDDACSNGCDGSGNCRREREGTVCGGAACRSPSLLETRTCSGQGACMTVPVPCTDGETCQENRCSAPTKRPPGEACVDNADCASNACIGGRCCASSCSGPCRLCTAASTWRCIDRTDETSCGPEQVCRGGRCVPRCADGRSLCGSACVDLERDPDNCGGCGRRCGSSSPNCVNRRCSKGTEVKPDAGADIKPSPPDSDVNLPPRPDSAPSGPDSNVQLPPPPTLPDAGKDPASGIDANRPGATDAGAPGDARPTGSAR